MTLGALRVSAIALSAGGFCPGRLLLQTRRPSLTIIGTLLICGSHTAYRGMACTGMSRVATRATATTFGETDIATFTRITIFLRAAVVSSAIATSWWKEFYDVAMTKKPVSMVRAMT